MCVEGKVDGLISGNTPALGYLSLDSRKSHETPQTVQPGYNQGFEKRILKTIQKDTHSRLHVWADCHRQNFVTKKTCSVVPKRYIQSLMLCSFSHLQMNSTFSA